MYPPIFAVQILLRLSRSELSVICGRSISTYTIICGFIVKQMIILLSIAAYEQGDTPNHRTSWLNRLLGNTSAVLSGFPEVSGSRYIYQACRKDFVLIEGLG
jgi:hypothetical protein